MNTFRSRGLLAFCLLLVAQVATAAPAEVEDAARPDFDAAEERFNANQYEPALPMFRAVKAKYRGGGAEQMASHRVALIHYASGRFDEAMAEWQDLLRRFPQTKLKFESTYNLAAAQHQKKKERECYGTLMTIPPSEVEQENESRSRVYYQLAAECANSAGFPSTAIGIYDTGYGRLRARDARVQYQSGVAAAARRIKDTKEVQRLAMEAKNSDTRETLLALLADPQRDPASEIESRIAASDKRFSINPQLGYGRIDYQQTALAEFQQSSLGLGLTGRFQWEPSWAVAFDSTLFLHPLRFTSATSKVGYLDFFLAVEYRRKIRQRWSIGGSIGPTYATLLVPEGTFGFRHLSGPQAKLSGGFRITERDRVSLDRKGALFNSDAATLSSANYRYGASVGYARQLTPDYALTLNLEYSQLRLFFSNGTASTSVFTAYAGCQF